MGSQNGDNVDTMKAEETRTLEPTVEIKIKTLDSKTYTLRVDKCVPVTTLKEKIARVTGIVSEQQRLICRGRVMKDDQLLPAYHVEDGHTLHLLVREPIPPSETMDDPAGPVNSPDAEYTQVVSGASRVVIRTFNISYQTQDSMADISREPPTVMFDGTTRSSSLNNSARRQPGSVSSNGQAASLGPLIARREHMHPPVIPDSVATLSQYLNQLTAAFAIANGEEENSASPGSSIFDDDFDAPELSQVAFRRRMPTAESLAEVLQSTRQLLINQTAVSLSRLVTQLQTQVNVTDASARMNIQSNATLSGINLGNLGALLIELGRTTTMLRMGETPADAVVNAGPAVVVNENGPNPILVFPMESEISHIQVISSVMRRRQGRPSNMRT